MCSSVLIIIVKPTSLFLDCSLASINAQSSTDFEVLFIADSAPADVVRYLERAIPNMSIPARIVWANEFSATDTAERNALRTALRTSTSTIIMVSDSVTILHHRFVEMHLSRQTTSCILTGPRVELSPELSSELTVAHVRDGWPTGSYSALLADGVFGHSTGVSHAFFFSSTGIQQVLSSKANDVNASNFSLHRNDAERLLTFLDTEKKPNAKLLHAHLGIQLLSYRNTFVQFRCNEPGAITLLRVSGMMQRVQQLRIPVPELGLRPAMKTSQSSL